MYRDENAFVRGQKIKLALAIVLAAIAIVANYVHTGTWSLP